MIIVKYGLKTTIKNIIDQMMPAFIASEVTGLPVMEFIKWVNIGDEEYD
jgi:hypothetical protein